MSTEHTDESAYLELKGMVIDWAMKKPQMEPKELIEMLRKIITSLMLKGEKK